MLHFTRGIRAITFIYKCIVISIYTIYCFIRFLGLFSSLVLYILLVLFSKQCLCVGPTISSPYCDEPIAFFYHMSSPGL